MTNPAIISRSRWRRQFGSHTSVCKNKKCHIKHFCTTMDHLRIAIFSDEYCCNSNTIKTNVNFCFCQIGSTVALHRIRMVVTILQLQNLYSAATLKVRWQKACHTCRKYTCVSIGFSSLLPKNITGSSDFESAKEKHLPPFGGFVNTVTAAIQSDTEISVITQKIATITTRDLS